MNNDAEMLWEMKKYKSARTVTINTDLFRWGTKYYLVQKLLSPLKTDRVLDIGCGYGTTLLSLKGQIKSGVGIDISATAISKARSIKRLKSAENLNFRLGNANKLNFSSESFDKIISFDVAEHLLGPQNLFIQIERLLKPGGKALVYTNFAGKFCWQYVKEWLRTGGQPKKLWHRDRDVYHLNRFDFDQLNSYLSSLGVNYRFIFKSHWLAPILTDLANLFRRFSRLARANSTGRTEQLKIESKVNIASKAQYYLALLELKIFSSWPSEGVYIYIEKPKTKTVVIAQTKTQVSWAIKHNFRNIIGTTAESQLALAKANYDYSQYLDLMPSSQQSKEYLEIAERFANNWFKGFSDNLKIQNASFGVFCRMHWLIFIPESLRSLFVVKSIVGKYQPDEVILFPKDERLEIVDDDRRLETFILQALGKSVFRRVRVRVISLPAQFAAPSFVWWDNLRRYLDYFSKKPGDFLLALKLLTLDHLPKFGTGTIDPKDLLIHLQRHITIDSMPLLRLVKKSQLSAVIVADSLLLSQRLTLAKENLKYVAYEQLQSPQDLNPDTIKIKSFWRLFKKSPDYHGLLKKYGLLSLAPAMTAQFEALFIEFIDQVARTMAISRDLMTKTLPKVVILSGNSGRRGLAMSYAAKAIGAKSFLFQHGVDVWPVQSSKIFDRMFVWGKLARDWYVRNLPLPKSRFIVPGWFYIDSIAQEANRYRRTLRFQKRKKYTILFPMSYYLVDNPKTFFIVLKVIREFMGKKKFRLVVRPHPGQHFPSGIDRILFPKADTKVDWDLGKNLDSQIQESDLVLTTGTTVGLRALLWGKPILHLKILDVLDEIDFTKYGAAKEVYRPEEIISKINEILTDKSAWLRMKKGREKFLAGYCFKLDGKSSSRVLDSVRQELNS